MNQYLLLVTLLVSHIAAADVIGNRFHQEVPNAKASIQSSLSNPNFKGFNAEGYCKDQACINEMNNPSQSQYLNNDAALIAEGEKQLVTNPNAANITEGFNNRPKHTIDPNDPAYRNAKTYMDNSYNISHGISNKYVDCEGGDICKYVDTKRQCSEPTGQPAYCHSEAYPINVNITNGRHVIPVNGEFGVLPLPQNMNVSQIDLPAIRRVPQTVPGGCESSSRPIPVDIHINGQKVTRVNGTFDVLNLGYSCRLSIAIPATSITFSPHKPLSSILIDFSSEHYFNMIAHGNIIVHTKKENTEMGWRDNCKGIPNQCSQTQEICVEGAGTRYINGVPVYLDCWKKKRTYQCQYPNTCTPLLGKAVTGAPLTCQIDNKGCKTQVLGVCVENSVNLTCEERQCEQTNLVCGETMFCLNGDCYFEEQKQNGNFSEAASALAALGEAAASLNADNLRIFTGKPAFCDKKPIGLSDCCADSGWGNDIGLTQCSAEEKGLASAKEKKLTIELGEYCAEKVLGVCIRKKKSYCQFDSKMTRIIQEQGKKQLGLGFGSKKHPDCQGFTPEQLQQVDFSKIDMSEFYGDLEANMELPNMQEIQDRINDKYGDLAQ
ncbi:type-F conjugative transfer system mating-pair stabilization protein TraN [Photobacterium damselae]|uniref:type-F conjugative transfer system mating-pair stabilization protein TraN n=1 Tax=Photobacterium damselae TaxID=38293 RepID=UPI002543F746